LFRPGSVHIAGIIRKKMRAKRRNPDDIGVRIVRPPSGMIILKVYFSRVGVFECNEPATGTTFFTLHTMLSLGEYVIKKGSVRLMQLWLPDGGGISTIFEVSVFFVVLFFSHFHRNQE
jgi:hypothetical protein